MEPNIKCVCGDVFDEHSETGECQVEGCRCACFEEEEEAEEEPDALAGSDSGEPDQAVLAGARKVSE